MAQAEESKTSDSHHLPIQMSNLSRDLLHRFISESQFPRKFREPNLEGEEDEAEEDNEDIELSLGLSLNGRFGVDPKRAKRLNRSSSIPDFVVNNESSSGRVMPVVGRGDLVRTCSLPTETEEDWRKRKEMQTLRRMEAKRKRSEKQRSWKDKALCASIFGSGARVRNGFELKGEKDSSSSGACIGGLLPPAAPLSQGSGGSRGSGSSGISDFDSLPAQGMNKCTEARSPASVQSLPECEKKPLVTNGSITTQKSGNFSAVSAEIKPTKPTVGDEGTNDMTRNVLEDMPCVTTKGDGPDGKRIEGFLYRYRKGEEVRIVCVCHGSFLTPAEFIKHAGGGDVANPLKHIVVNPTSLL
ncbi:ninja-family protein AFP3-like [Tripterygium wilfordii]|uniref:ninja-family protein AFP3-like n=1 Tax=Tripterygium wilfordii TaxID=458696 RepID=UPI0018F82059|nr:ninja-family protein AFP3-like [Tripterygium wilfordii]